MTTYSVLLRNALSLQDNLKRTHRMKKAVFIMLFILAALKG